MSFDFNRAGQQYQMVAASRQAGFGMLSSEPLALLERLQAQQCAEYSDAEARRQRWLLDAAGCLHRLEGFLFQLSRVPSRSRRGFREARDHEKAPARGARAIGRPRVAVRDRRRRHHGRRLTSSSAASDILGRSRNAEIGIRGMRRSGSVWCPCWRTPPSVDRA